MIADGIKVAKNREMILACPADLIAIIKALKSRTTQKRRVRRSCDMKEPSDRCNIAVFEDRKETRAKDWNSLWKMEKSRNWIFL